MQSSITLRRALIGALALTAATPFAGTAEAASKAPTDVTVMTRNLYLGGDIFKPVTATAGKSGLDALNAFGNVNFGLLQTVDATDFPARAELLAAELKQRKPDLVGLQEVATWRTGPYSIDKLGTPTATTVRYDFLKSLQSALKKAGEPYVVVRNQEESDVEGPAFPNTFQTAAADGGFNGRLTMHDVILRRKASKVRVSKAGSKQYKTTYSVDLSGVKFEFKRGYLWADAKIGKRKFRFVNTHLESATSKVADAQAKELLAGPIKGAGKKPVIAVCDCNSDPLDSSSKPDDVPHKTAYDRIAKTLTDEWLQVKTAASGFSSGLSETVNDANLDTIDHRIDLVWGKKVKALKAWRTGDKARTKAGLWASDHMGVVVKLRPGG
jgi:endonuclease/exonuclease/phosphatase family metal-dependent hydrolase